MVTAGHMLMVIESTGGSRALGEQNKENGREAEHKPGEHIHKDLKIQGSKRD